METTNTIIKMHTWRAFNFSTRGQCSHLEGIPLLRLPIQILLRNRQLSILVEMLLQLQLRLRLILYSEVICYLSLNYKHNSLIIVGASSNTTFAPTTFASSSPFQQQQQTTVTSPSTYPFQYLQQCFDPNSVNYRFRVRVFFPDIQLIVSYRPSFTMLKMI
jgi:hypothetical protein